MQLSTGGISQYHRIVVVRKEPLDVIWPNLLHREGHLESVVQDHVPVAFEHLQGRTLHNLCGESVPLLSHPHNKKKKVFPDVQMEPSVFHFVPIASVTWHHWKEPDSNLHAPSNSLQEFEHVYNTSPQPWLLQTEKSQLSESFLIEEMFQSLLAKILLMQPWTPLVFFATRMCCYSWWYMAHPEKSESFICIQLLKKILPASFDLSFLNGSLHSMHCSTKALLSLPHSILASFLVL